MALKQLSFPESKLSHQSHENELVNVILKRWADPLSGQPTVEVLPPGIDIDTWKVILSRFLEIFGDEGVIVGDEHELNYLDIFSLAENEHDIRDSPRALPGPLSSTSRPNVREPVLAVQLWHRHQADTVVLPRAAGFHVLPHRCAQGDRSGTDGRHLPGPPQARRHPQPPRHRQ